MLNPLPQFPVYPLLPVRLVSGRGAVVTDETGLDYLDLFGGHAVASVGHCHPRLAAAISEQAGRLVFYSNSVEMTIRERYASRLVATGPTYMKSVFFCNSGAEANENALTLARIQTGRKVVVSVEGGFHGRTLLTLSVSGIEKYRKLAAAAGEPLFTHHRLIAPGDVAAARELIREDTAAVIVEPILGVTGAIALPREFLATLRERCDAVGACLIFDEVQCGSGRSGSFTVAQELGIAPNLLTLAKGLAGGFPIGAVLADEAATGVAASGMLGSTFGGGPLACAAGLATLDIMTDESLMANARLVGEHLRSKLAVLKGVAGVHGLGLMIGIDLECHADKARHALLTRHRIIVGASMRPQTLRLLPPLALSLTQADEFLTALHATLS